jgi:hypothetical protein
MAANSSTRRDAVIPTVKPVSDDDASAVVIPSLPAAI